MAWHRNTQPAQEFAGLRFGLPSIQFAELGLEFGTPHAVRFIEIRLRIQRVLFLHDGVQALVAHQHRRQGFELVEGEMILFEHGQPQTRRHDDLPGKRVDIAG